MASESNPRFSPEAHARLRAIAARYMQSEGDDHTLEATALVHEAWMEVQSYDRIKWKSEAHFVAACAQKMRQILIDHARAKASQKRGGGLTKHSYESGIHGSAMGNHDLLLALDDALTALSKPHPRQAKIAEGRLFGEMTLRELSDTLEVDLRRVRAEWDEAKKWLMKRIPDDTT